MWCRRPSHRVRLRWCRDIGDAGSTMEDGGRRCSGGSRCLYWELGFEALICTSNGPKFPDVIQWWEIIVPSLCQPTSRAVPRPALRVDVEARARHYDLAVPSTGTMGALPCRARSVPVPAQRAWPIWPSMKYTCESQNNFVAKGVLLCHPVSSSSLANLAAAAALLRHVRA